LHKEGGGRKTFTKDFLPPPSTPTLFSKIFKNGFCNRDIVRHDWFLLSFSLFFEKFLKRWGANIGAAKIWGKESFFQKGCLPLKL